MKKIEYCKIARDINSLYIYLPKDEDWFKVGECHTGVFIRGVSNDYWTVQKNDGKFVAFFTYKKINKKEMMMCEKMLIELCDQNAVKGGAGREVYILKKEKKEKKEWSSIEEVISKIKDFISEKLPIFDSYFENTVSEIRKIIKYKHFECGVDYEIINNVESICSICDKPLKSKIYRVLIKVDDQEIKCDIGKDCFKKHCQNDNILKKQHIRRVEQCFSKIKKKINTKKCSEDFVDDESIIDSDAEESDSDAEESDSEIFDLFYNRFSSNSGFLEKDIVKLEFDLMKYYHLDILKKYILWGALSYCFAKKGSFSLKLNNEMLEYIKKILYDKDNDNYKKYNDSDKYLVLFSISSHPSIFSVEGDNIKFIHTKLIHLIDNLKDLLQLCEPIKVDIKNLRPNTIKYSNEQLEALNNNKFVTGVPGGGKSELIMEKIYSIKKSKQCFVLFTPTHSSKDELLQKIISHGDIKDDVVKVIHSLSEGFTDYLLNVKYKNRKEINFIIDEFSMFDINHWYKIKYFLDICFKSNKKVFIFFTGDPFQLKPIHFSNETDVFTSFISDESLKLRETHRGDFHTILENKTKLTNDRLPFIYQGKYIEGSKDDLNKIIEKELIANAVNNKQISVFITPENKDVNSINKFIYDIKKQECKNCPRDLRVGDLYYCDNCVHMFKFRISENKAYTKSKLSKNKLKIGNIEEKLSYEDFSKIENNTTSTITTINNNKIIINEFSESTIFINNDTTTYYLRNENSKNYDLISYNGDKFTIQKTDEKDIYILRNNTKTHYVTRSFITDSKICLSYAETTYKSQGRTYSNTIFIVEEDKQTDVRNIYVGTTRFKKDLLVFKIKGSEMSSDNTEYVKTKTEIYYSKCKVILLWANTINPSFDKNFTESIVDRYLKTGKISDKQQISIDNIINKFRIPY